MKFRNPKNGEVYDLSTGTCDESGFCLGITCSNCELKEIHRDTGMYCSDWIRANPELAAIMMGYEYLGDGETNAKKCSCTRQYILHEAERCVCGDRDQQYGSPENSFKAIAALWKDYLEARGCVFPNGDSLGAKDAAAMMVLFKMARVATGQSKDDNWIDAAGYAACGGEIGGKE